MTGNFSRLRILVEGAAANPNDMAIAALAAWFMGVSPDIFMQLVKTERTEK